MDAPMQRYVENPDSREFDILIIGGGITGCAVAYEAAGRGLSVCLVEKGDFGGATSAATSKEIHGGLRYLKNGEFKLVRESLRERRILANIAPNLVHPLAHLMPLYNLKAWERASMSFGLTLYDLLSHDRGKVRDPIKRIPPHRMLSASEALALEPGIRSKGLSCAAVYYDCQNLMPERLTLAFLKSAMRRGARASNYAKVETLLGAAQGRNGGRVQGAGVRDLLNGREMEIKAGLVINCAGPWADLVLNRAGVQSGQSLRRSEGIHIVTKPLVRSHGVARVHRQGGHFFVLPWRGHSLIGTTDQDYDGDPDDYQVRAQSIQMLLDQVNAGFGFGDLELDDVLYAYGGLRPLVEDQTKGTYQTSRRYEVNDHEQHGLAGLITVEGGKYTTSRGLAESVVPLAAAKLGKEAGPCLSRDAYLDGCEIPSLSAFLSSAPQRLVGAEPSTALTLSQFYGNEAGAVWALGQNDPEMARSLNSDGEIMAQVAYAARFEMARTLNDILLRRTGLGTLGHPGAEVLEQAARVAARELGWDQDRREQEIARIEAALKVPGKEDGS
jgi:glycerol-3-phosphate dehydrogenase